MLRAANELRDLSVAVDEDVAEGRESLEEVGVEWQRRSEQVRVALGGAEGLGALGGHQRRAARRRHGCRAGQRRRPRRQQRQRVAAAAAADAQRCQRVLRAARPPPFAAAACPAPRRPLEHLRDAAAAQARRAGGAVGRVHALVLLEL